MGGRLVKLRTRKQLALLCYLAMEQRLHTRDALAELSLLKPVVKGLGSRATLNLLEGADHSFHVLKSSGRNDREVMKETLDAFAAWMDRVVG